MDETAIVLLVVGLVYLGVFGGALLSSLILWKVSYGRHEENRPFMANALAKLQTNWGGPIGIVALYYAVAFVASIALQFISIFGQVGIPILADSGNNVIPIIALLVLLYLSIVLFIFPMVFGPAIKGFVGYFQKHNRNQPVKVTDLFSAFKRGSTFKKGTAAYFLMQIYTMLWSLLFRIPGIIAAYSYSLTYFIMNDEPELSVGEAIEKSKKMMHGNKAQLFWLSCRFIGWHFVAMMASGIGYLWLAPYMTVSFANFYESLKENGNSIPLVENA